jgi:hypothetical protein
MVFKTYLETFRPFMYMKTSLVATLAMIYVTMQISGHTANIQPGM